MLLQLRPFASKPFVFWNWWSSISNTPDPRTYEDTKSQHNSEKKNKAFFLLEYFTEILLIF